MAWVFSTFFPVSFLQKPTWIISSLDIIHIYSNISIFIPIRDYNLRPVSNPSVSFLVLEEEVDAFQL